jgi:hypothetical protein
MSLERIEQFIEHQKEEERLQKEVLDKTMYYTRALTANKSRDISQLEQALLAKHFFCDLFAL